MKNSYFNVLELPGEPSTKFARGRDFKFVMELPQSVHPKDFEGWTLKCHLRRLDNSSDAGFIADIDCQWTDEDCIAIRFNHRDTDDWPLCPAEFDVVLSSPTGEARIRSEPVRIEIVYGVTA